jgi:hypothetical protein
VRVRIAAVRAAAGRCGSLPSGQTPVSEWTIAGPAKIDPVPLFSVVIGLIALTAASFCGLLRVMAPEYRVTFFSALTGSKHQLDLFADLEGAGARPPTRQR